MRTATMNPNLLLAVTGLTILLSASALAGDVKVIANPSVKADAISAREIKSVFLEERNSLRDGTHVEPVLSRGGPAHAAFLKDYLGQNDDALQTTIALWCSRARARCRKPCTPMKRSLLTSRGHEAPSDT
jgi:hypothetical protein